MNAEAKFVSSVMDARLKKAKRERDAYKKQRDELINDMAEVKRKAEAFDEVRETIKDFEKANSRAYPTLVNVLLKRIVNEYEEANND